MTALNNSEEDNLRKYRMESSNYKKFIDKEPQLSSDYNSIVTKKDIIGLDRLIFKSLLNNQIKLYCGVNEETKVKNHTYKGIYIYNNFISTSLHSSIAIRFALPQKNKPVLLVFTLPEKFYAYKMDPIHTHEYEYLIGRDIPFKIDDIKYKKVGNYNSCSNHPKKDVEIIEYHLSPYKWPELKPFWRIWCWVCKCLLTRHDLRQ